MKTWLRNVLLAGLVINGNTAQAYSTDNGAIYDGSGQSVQLRGVNWFGFEVQDHVAHGLWSRNWKDMILQMKSLGFNAVRIPVCPATLHGASVTGIDYAQNPDLANKNSLQILDLVLTEFDRQGMYILLDHHRPDCNAISELWYTGSYSTQNWIDDLVLMANRYKLLPHMIGIDLKNEPHGAATWGTGNVATDWNTAAESAAAAINKAAPDLLLFVEGIENNPSCSGSINHWWGGNLEALNCTPLAIPSNRLVLAPHVYGPDVYNQPYFSDPNFPNNMPAIWEAHIGQFMNKGYTIAIGETGGRYGHGGSAKDKVFQDALVNYLINKKIAHLFYWSWNPNSGDTGGILQDDWRSIWQDKVDLLTRLWNGTGTLEPAACSDGLDNDKDGLADFPADKGCTSATDRDETDPLPPPSAACADGLDNDSDGLIDYPKDSGCTSATDNDEYNAPLPPTKTQLPATVSITADWVTGYCADVNVTNNTVNKVEWTTLFKVPGIIKSFWSGIYTKTGDDVKASGLDWNKILNPGAYASVGFCADRPVVTPKNACEDGKDNDADGLIDYPKDPGCSSATDNDETNSASGSVTATLNTTSDWGTGYCANVDVKNTGATTVQWQISLTIQGKVSNVWNAIYTQSGNTLTAKGVSWNSSVSANGTVQFGFCANR
ncbi:glycoside hydrolase family 5 protein [Crenothrix polyspora]|uniref:cellulase n=1 Tax=Crenothrix polyspora TaxID=360316 RepID=A0A1R4HGQ6_9GAMM|nr:glycoside hydrolase family 5 protein [Crenothrix polyspora]SJM95404.1 putative Cellulase [Crenothrix polyspora]